MDLTHTANHTATDQAATRIAQLEEQVQHLTARLGEADAAAARRARTGVLLAHAREDLGEARGYLLTVASLAARHHRGDPYGPQGAAAQQILDALTEPLSTDPVARLTAGVLSSAAAAIEAHASCTCDPACPERALAVAGAPAWLRTLAVDIAAGRSTGLHRP